MEIRIATDRDIPELLEAALEFHKESNFASSEIHIGKVSSSLETALRSKRNLVLSFLVDGTVVGGFWGVITEFYFSHDLVSSDKALFIKKEFRGKIPIRKVLTTYANWAKKNGCKRINISTSTGYKTGRLEKLYERIGFHRVGANFALMKTK